MQHTPYQLCPKCLGEATVPTPNSTAVNTVCPVCNGGRIIPMFTIPDEPRIAKVWQHKIDTYLEEVKRSFDKIIATLQSQGV